MAVCGSARAVGAPAVASAGGQVLPVRVGSSGSTGSGMASFDSVAREARRRKREEPGNGLNTRTLLVVGGAREWNGVLFRRARRRQTALTWSRRSAWRTGGV